MAVGRALTSNRGVECRVALNHDVADPFHIRLVSSAAPLERSQEGVSQEKCLGRLCFAASVVAHCLLKHLYALCNIAFQRRNCDAVGFAHLKQNRGVRIGQVCIGHVAEQVHTLILPRKQIPLHKTLHRVNPTTLVLRSPIFHHDPIRDSFDTSSSTPKTSPFRFCMSAE